MGGWQFRLNSIRLSLLVLDTRYNCLWSFFDFMWLVLEVAKQTEWRSLQQ